MSGGLLEAAGDHGYRQLASYRRCAGRIEMLAATLSVHDLAAFVVHVLAGLGGDEGARPVL